MLRISVLVFFPGSGKLFLALKANERFLYVS